MKKVAFFLPNLTGGGAEKVSVNLLKEMVSYKDIQIDLILGNATGAFIKEVPSNVTIVDLKTKRMFNTIWPLAKYLRREKPDSLLAHISHTNVIALIAKRLANSKVRVSVVEHNNLEARDTRFLRSYVVRLLMRHLYPSSEHIIGVSKGVTKNIQEKLKLKEAKFVTIYNPVVMPEILTKAKENITHPWLVENNTPVYLGVGRFTAQKDFKNLLRAFALAQQKINARLIILGDGPMRAELEQEIRDLDLTQRVSLPGFVENPYAYMYHSSCFVLSSKYEGLPTVLIEAMACGCNVVSTDCPYGPDEILLNGKLGKLVPIEDHLSLSSAMVKAITSPIEPNLLKQRALHFSPKIVVPQYVSILT